MLDTNAMAVADAIAEYRKNVVKMTRHALDATGANAVDHARSYTGITKPGVRATQLVRFTTSSGELVEFVAWADKGEGPRQVHPGGWADVSNNLRNGYRHRVTGTGRIVRLSIWNNMGYAHALEANGYWVVSGLFEGYVQMRFQHWLNEVFTVVLNTPTK